MPDTFTALTDLEPVEVSLVKKGANRKRIAFRKGEDMPKTREEILKSVLETKIENEDQIKIEGVTEDASAAIVVAARAIHGFADVIPETAHAEIAKALGLKLKPETVIVEKRVESAKDPIAELSPEARAMFAKAKEQAEAAEKKAVEVAKALEVERAERRSKEFVEKASAYKTIGGDLTKTGELLRRVTDLDPELAGHLESVLKTAEEVAKKSELFKSIGTSKEPEALTAYQKIERVAEEIRKSEPKLTKHQAIARAVDRNPELAHAYRAEKGN